MYFQAMSYAIDNTQLLPPYFPLGRNSDGAFAQLYLLSDSQAWISHLPWAISHVPDHRREYLLETVHAFSRIRMADLLILCMRSAFIPTPITRQVGLVCIGEQLKAIASLPPKSFCSYVLTRLSDRNRHLQELISEKLPTVNDYPQLQLYMNQLVQNATAATLKIN